MNILNLSSVHFQVSKLSYQKHCDPEYFDYTAMKLALVCLVAMVALACGVPVPDPPKVTMTAVKAAPKKAPPILCRKDDQACIDRRAGKTKRSADDRPPVTFKKLQLKPEMPLKCMKDDAECIAKLEAQKKS